ncbi:MAG TPA: MFS transporter [Verrucomicrobiales bacterium]|jgi:MFS family permease|nr:MFS transporter [Verrucomicrobiales bacterium]
MHTDADSGTNRKLFLACFIALVATSFIFGVRANIIGELQEKFNLSEAQKGNINGVGMWPFALSIIVFSLIIDRIGYKTAALVAITCHVVSLILTVMATGYESLYWSTFLVAVSNGVVESFINPVVATIFSKNKTKWLNILHAGWPAGLALGALFTVILKDMSWQWKFGACFAPVILYALLILPRKFPVNERVAAGISYRDMLREVGAIGFFAIGALVAGAVAQMAGIEANLWMTLGIGAVVAVAAGVYTGSAGNWLFLVVLLTMGPLATSELGTDGWMPDLLKFSGPDIPQFATWVFIYVSTIMTILRFCAGPVVHRFSPIGLLVISAAIAIAGLFFLSSAAGWMVVVAATVYAFGKTFLWSTTLGMVSEQFPKGGALTLNGVSAVGVLGLGIIGSPFIGFQQDKEVDRQLRETQPALHAMVNGPEKTAIFGQSPSLDAVKVNALPKAQKDELDKVQAKSKQATFARIAMLPSFMLVCYLGMFLYFRSRGGYKPVEIGAGSH